MFLRLIIAKVFVIAVLASGCLSVSNRCLPGDLCFPANIVWIKFMETLDGNLYFPHTREYDHLVMQRNSIYTKFPFAIVEVKNTADVQKSVLFARKHNLLVSIKTSGHDFIGRSTAHGSLQIFLGSMNATKIHLFSIRNPAGEITCESGNTWLKVYEEVDRHNRTIVGGSGHTVSVAGYTLGGGHSPMSRMFGLAVDNLLEIEMVTAEGHVVVANKFMTQTSFVNGTFATSNDTDIFWASRGGGGGTFGIVTKFTFKLHYPAPQIVQFLCSYPIQKANGQKYGFTVLKKIFSMLTSLPKEWGGYLLISGVPDKSGNFGNVMLAMNHHGPFHSATRAYLDQLKNFQQDWQSFCFYKNFSSYYDYDKTSKETSYFPYYSSNTLLHNHNFTDDLISFILQKVKTGYSNSSHMGMTGTFLGGEVKTIEHHENAVNPALRSSLMSLTATTYLPTTDLNYSAFLVRGEEIGKELNKFGLGQYVNNAGNDVISWQKEFWGNNYRRLLKIKKKWDPDNFFTCKECVGSEEIGPNFVDGVFHIPIGPPFGK
ncbi:uncharacterized protein LOC133182275 [Saccostrea echinata]|uniref:uncharacterized protein LOC133182275 n=1 Tax=Saccostrea echinata TaxID=191078 RepID=UPI002A80C31B|nr:uncharacterized protein LOC133182275 [Saccostrea echinata]